MGALAPKTRLYGLVVFVILTLLLNTVEIETNVHMSVIIIILMTIYGSIEYRRIGLKHLLPLVLPFIVFIAIVSPINHYIFEGFVGAIFYWFVTDKRYIAFCKKTANEANVIVD